MSDLYMTELDRVLSSSPSTSSPCPLVSLLAPFTTLAARTPSPVVYTRRMETLFLPLLKALAAVSAATAGTVEGPTGKKRKTANGAAASEAEGASVKGAEGYEAIVQGSEPASAASQKMAVLVALFSAAADEKAKEANRRKVYIVWNEMRTPRKTGSAWLLHRLRGRVRGSARMHVRVLRLFATCCLSSRKPVLTDV